MLSQVPLQASIGEQANSAGPSDPLAHHADGSTCSCPACTLSYYITLVYSNQRQSSRHVMAARPSPYYAETNGIPPPPPPLVPIQLTSCPMFDEYGFCTYGKFCLLPHYTRQEPRVPHPNSLEEAMKTAITRAKEEEEMEKWTCGVCGQDGINDSSTTRLGTLLLYRNCPRCTLACYFPHIQHIIDIIIDEVGDDYQLFKSKIEECRATLPDILKVPLSFEAHRMGYTVFAWSLVSPADARDSFESVMRTLPDLEMIVSVGSGTGYIEHLFNRVVNGVGAAPYGPRSSVGSTSSFDGVHTSLDPGRRIYIFAFDELARPTRYSVTVGVGGPTAVLSLDCPKAALLLCWPPFGSPQGEQSSMGFEAIEYFTQAGGKAIIYIGDIFSTGDWRMHEMLHTHYQLVKDYPVRRELRRWLPTDMALIYAGNDSIGVYKRRDTPLPPQQWKWDMP